MNEIVIELRKIPFEKVVDDCLTIDNRSKFYIIEENEMSKISMKEEDEQKSLMIINSNEKNIHHICIDKCLFTDASSLIGKKADSFIFNQMDLYIIDYKFDTKPRNFASNASVGRKQIGNTIEYLQKNNFSFEDKKVYALVVHRNATHPRFSSRLPNLDLEFKAKYNTNANYKEDNKIEFN